MSREAGDRPFWFEVRLYGALAVFLVLGGIVYGVTADEAAGTVLLILAGVLAAIVCGYLGFQERLIRTAARSRAAGEEPPAQEEPFLPHASVWPFEVGVGMTLTLSGFALGWAVLVPGLLVTVHGLWGWAVQSRYRDPH